MTTFGLKFLALALMTLDHIGYYFPGAPVWLRWLGRASYPLFLFCMAWGYHYTRDRRKYLLRLYVMSVLMTVLGLWLDTVFPTLDGYGNHNIFVPLFLTGVCISIIEAFQREPRKGAWMLAALAVVQLLFVLLPGLIPPLQDWSGDRLTGLVPNLAVNEYGFPFIALGVAMYFLREDRRGLCGVYLLFCLYQFSEELLGGDGMPTQWMMVLALPLMLRYNRQKGPGLKWLFYLYYPAHTVCLFWLANFVLT